MMCCAPKSRAGCHFCAAIGLRSLLEDFKLEITDWAYDQHTHKGRKMGPGLQHFCEEGAKLVPPPKGMIRTSRKLTACGRSNSSTGDHVPATPRLVGWQTLSVSASRPLVEIP
jgi:hypothetical protein